MSGGFGARQGFTTTRELRRVSLKTSPAKRHFHRNTDYIVFGTQACFVLSPFSEICDETGF